MLKDIFVEKRNGTKELFDITKIKKSIEFAVTDTDASQLELESKFDQFIKNNIKTSDIQKNVIQHAVQLASPQNPEWLLVAGRAYAMDLWSNFKLRDKTFSEVVKYNIKKGEYTKDLLNFYTDNDIEELGKFVDFNRDLKHSYSSLVTVVSKYLGKFELNQHMHMVNAMRFGQLEPKETRLEFVKQVYDILSLRKLSLATPFMANIRKGGNVASCFIIAIEDDLNSIFDNVKRVAKISKNGGGLGIFLGYIRAKGSTVNGYSNASGSVIQWVKIINSTLVAVNQGGKRAGAGTVALPIWHNDILDFLDMQSEHGDIRLKSYDVFPQITVPDIFMERDLPNGKWVTFCPFEVKNVLDIDVRNKYGQEFTSIYLQIEQAFHDGKLKVAKEHSARDLIKLAMRPMFETGLPYVAFIDTINETNPNKFDDDTNGIVCVNLCVAPETQILTDNGYHQISELENMNINIWNGEQYSNTVIKKTGTNQKLLKVITSSGQELECTEYHKFYVVTSYGRNGNQNCEEVRAYQLKSGDKLIKFDLPIIEGYTNLQYAYDNGFYTADGCKENNRARIYLYHDKQKLKPFLKSVTHWNDEFNNGNRSIGTSKLLKEKYFVPTNSYTIESRLNWFAGLCDGDGTIARNGTNESIQIVSIHKEFLKEVQLMLQTLGVTSKIQSFAEAGMRMLPKNDGTNTSALYNCKQSYRLLVSSTGLFKLSELGFNTNRLQWEHRLPQRCAEQFIQIVDVIDEGRYDDTYCFSEPIRHMGMFNGILTGQCTESFSNVKSDTYGHVCNLASINLSNINNVQTSDELAIVSKLAMKLLDYGIELTNNPDVITANHNQKYRTIGIGLMGLHDHLAKEFLNYSSLDYIKEIAECVEYNAVLQSVEQAKLLGSFGNFDKSLWESGDLTKKFKSHTSNQKYDWGYAQSQIDTYGMRCSQLTSPAPTTSTSIYQDCSASILPTYSAFFSEDNKQGKLLVASRFLKENPLAYGKTFSKFTATEIIDVVSVLQYFTDTGISMELIFDQNREDFKAKNLWDAIHYAHQQKIKAIYYIRSIKKNETLNKQEADCVSCAG
jgi:ribonucleoside-diphosphate reductase alpha chain